MNPEGWNALDPELRELAERILTRRQLDTLKLHACGAGYDRIARVLGISRTTARGHLDAALTKLRAHPDYPRRQTPV